MDGNNVCYVKGIGTIKLSLNFGKSIFLTNVRYNPCLKRNLIYLGTLDDIGCSCSSQNGEMHVYRNGKLIFSDTKCNGLYVLNGSHRNLATCASPFTTSIIDTVLTWHMRSGHISSQSLGFLHKLCMLGKMCNTKLPFCDTCILAKKHRHSFSFGIHNSKSILDYLHAGLWDPESY